jgi:5-methylcytosine-specific restriction protein A
MVFGLRRFYGGAAWRCTVTDRIRGRRLQEIREAHFRMHPLCVHCDQRGIVRLATQLDHIVAITNGGRDVQSNRQGLCVPCHAVKTAADLGHKPKGCDASGMPTDPRHPWFKG